MFFWNKKKNNEKGRNSEFEVSEEGVKIKSYGTHISRDLKVFYNPLMKLNRDISLLVIDSYFKDKKIRFCDPMIATGIREIRFLKSIPSCFKSMILGDISKTAISNTKKNFKLNGVGRQVCDIEFKCADAVSTINSGYFDFIEIDPFGSPVPFLDAACQKIKHKGILSVTATDTAALCGTYPKTTLRKYGIAVQMTHFYDELGLRNLVAYVQRQGAKYNKVMVPILTYSQDHYYKIFFKVMESRTGAVKVIKDLKYISWDKKSQEVKILEFEEKGCFGKTYVGPLWNNEFVGEVLSKCKCGGLLEDNKKILKLLEKLKVESQLNAVVGYYNVSKFQKEHKFECHKKFDELLEAVVGAGFSACRTHNSRLGIKTNMDSKSFMGIMKK